MCYLERLREWALLAAGRQVAQSLTCRYKKESPVRMLIFLINDARRAQFLSTHPSPWVEDSRWVTSIVFNWCIWSENCFWVFSGKIVCGELLLLGVIFLKKIFFKDRIHSCLDHLELTVLPPTSYIAGIQMCPLHQTWVSVLSELGRGWVLSECLHLGLTHCRCDLGMMQVPSGLSSPHQGALVAEGPSWHPSPRWRLSRDRIWR